jgi:hypothetical protein
MAGAVRMPRRNACGTITMHVGARSTRRDRTRRLARLRCPAGARSRGSLAKAACREQELQFLDDTVRGLRTRLVRHGEGHVALRRIFVFEFSEDGVNRRDGSVTMLGAEVESMQLEPYRLS